MTDFGASFKKARQAKGISLDQIAQETRISTRFLQAIENEDFHLLPGGIFNRGFVRAYAERVGLDPDQSVTQYERLAQVHEPAEPMRTSAMPRKGDRHLYPIALGALLLLIVIFYAVSRNSGSTAETANEAPPVQQPAPSQPEPVPAPTPEPPPVAAPAKPEPADEPLVVEMQAQEPTWIRVLADGTTMNSADGEILQPGATRRFTAENTIDISIGNAGGVALSINGELAQPLGRSGQVRQLRITPENFKDMLR